MPLDLEPEFHMTEYWNFAFWMIVTLLLFFVTIALDIAFSRFVGGSINFGRKSKPIYMRFPIIGYSPLATPMGLMGLMSASCRKNMISILCKQ